MSERTAAEMVREFMDWQLAHYGGIAAKVPRAQIEAELVSRINYWAETQRDTRYSNLKILAQQYEDQVATDQIKPLRHGRR